MKEYLIYHGPYGVDIFPIEDGTSVHELLREKLEQFGHSPDEVNAYHIYLGGKFPIDIFPVYLDENYE